MRTPNRTFAVDWSGAKSGFKRKIWLAEVKDGDLVRLESGRSREEVRDVLIAEAASDPHFVVGFDFAFSFPASFVRGTDSADGPAFWRHVRRHGEGWLDRAEPPFFERGRFPGEPRDAFRSTDWVLRGEGKGRGPETVFKLFGQTQVGKGSVRGMPILADLQDSGFSIWPFDAPALPLVVEIYPRLFYGSVAKSSPEARSARLGDYPGLSAAQRQLAASSDDAFDAAVSALDMDPRRGEFAELPTVVDEIRRLEGAIWPAAVD